MRLPRVLSTMTLACAIGVVFAPSASAQDFAGKTASFGDLKASLSNGTVKAFRTRTGRLQTCSGIPIDDSSGDPQDLVYVGPPVAVVAGRFHLEGTSKDTWGDPFHWVVDGAVSLSGRELTGTASVSGDTVFAKQCFGTWSFDAIVPPRSMQARPRSTFVGAASNSSFNPGVAFDYSRGVIRRLTAHVGVECPSTSVLPATLNTTAYGIDPVRVDRAGRFRISDAVLDAYGVVTRYVLTGRIRGATATGRLTSYRFDESNGGRVRCSRNTSWRSVTRVPTRSSAPSAYYDVTPYRVGLSGAWSYYLVVKLNGCGGADRVRVSIRGGASKSTTCRGKVKLGPLAPQRRYLVRVVALRTRAGKVLRRAPAVPSDVYLPGEDGDWIRLN